MTKWNERSGLRGTVLPTAFGVAAMGVGVAVWAAGPYINAGSDTLGDVAPYTITQSGANLTYQALGSGTGENNMNAVPPKQSIAFMSRNIKASILTPHPTWAPGVANVLGLDAAVIVESSWASRMQNVQLPQSTGTPTGKFDVYNDMSLLLAGKGAQGTDAACRHPDRLAAYKRWATPMHTGGYIDHFYRRNDASGTSDTIRERVLYNAGSPSGGRYCNGQAPGGVKSAGPPMVLYTNEDAEDMDPIRRDCPAAVYDSSTPPNLVQRTTKCIYYPYNYGCTHGQVAAGTETVGSETVPAGTLCTQGFVVALTQGDPDLSNPGKDLDVTVSMAKRVAADEAHSTLGFAGRESVKTVGVATAGPTINHISFSDASVRGNFYPLSRRLYLNHGDNVSDSGQQAEEDKLYSYAVTNNGRCHMQPIMPKFGFVACHTNCNPATWGTSYNLCEDGDIPGAETTMTLCIAGGKNFTSGVCCSTGAAGTVGSPCPDPASGTGSGSYCNSTAECAAGLTCKPLAGSTFNACQP